MPLPITTGEYRVMKEPNFRSTNNGTSVWSAFVSAGEKRKNTETYDNHPANVVVFGENAEALANLPIEVGSYLVISGKIRESQYKTNEGEERKTTEINATFGFVVPKPPRQQGQGQPQGQPQGQGQPAGDPFGNPQAMNQGYGQPPQGYGPPQGQGYGQPQGYPNQGQPGPQQGQQNPWQGQPSQGQPGQWGGQPGPDQSPF